MAGPWQRRGGDRTAVLGGVARQEKLQRGKEGGGRLRRDAWKLAGRRWCGEGGRRSAQRW